MHVRELAVRQTIGATADQNQLECFLAAATDDYFKHFAPATGDNRSVRVFSGKPFEGSASLPQPLSAGEMAWQLMRFTSEARYPENNDRPGLKKGWSVTIAAYGNMLLTTAWAVWV